MQNNEYVYFLSVKEAETIAKKHANEPGWDLWADDEAQSKGMNNTVEKAS